jgi:hypothetical protein
MASHARGPGDSGSADKLTLYGSIGTALIGAAAVIIVGVMNNPNVSTTLSNEARQDTGLRFSPIINGKLTVSGSAQKDVNGMFVLIGPKQSGQYDAGCGNVVNQQWRAEVATDLSWQKYPLQTVAAYGSCPGGTTLASAFKFTFQGTEPTTSPPPPDQILDCAVQFGPSCFTGPGFGPPSVYQPNQ